MLEQEGLVIMIPRKGAQVAEISEKDLKDVLEVRLGLEELAELAGLSLSGFKQKFRRETGITPREYINLLKIEKAKALLRAGSSVTETAFSLDFSSSSYFSVLFKQMEDMSPSEYVRLHGKKQSEL